MHLRPADLEKFLRERRSADCQIAADWVADHPEHRATADAVAALESHVLLQAGNPRMFYVFCKRLLRWVWPAAPDRALAALSLVADVQCDRPYFEELREAAAVNWRRNRGAVAGAIVRTIKRAARV